jgi:hypothetical protein
MNKRNHILALLNCYTFPKTFITPDHAQSSCEISNFQPFFFKLDEHPWNSLLSMTPFN